MARHCKETFYLNTGALTEAACAGGDPGPLRASLLALLSRTGRHGVTVTNSPDTLGPRTGCLWEGDEKRHQEGEGEDCVI